MGGTCSSKKRKNERHYYNVKSPKIPNIQENQIMEKHNYIYNDIYNDNHYKKPKINDYKKIDQKFQLNNQMDKENNNKNNKNFNSD